MKNLISKTKFVVMSLLIVLFISCDGEDGAIGPAGQNGIDGTDGANGIDGQDGNANVIASDWFTVTQSDWSGIGATKITHSFSAPEISQGIIDSGVVLIYHRFNGQTRQLPYSYSPDGLHLVYLFTVSSVTLEGFHLNGSAINTISPLGFRYIIIPSNISTKSSGIDFTKMSYEEVMDYFKLNY